MMTRKSSLEYDFSVWLIFIEKKFLRIMLEQEMTSWRGVERKGGAVVVHRLPLLGPRGRRDLALPHTHI